MSSRVHDQFQELLGAVALGAATPEEIAAVERHALSCAECSRDLASLRAGADLLALAPEGFDPPPSLRQNLMAQVRAEAEALALPPADPVRSGVARRRARSWSVRQLLRPWPATALALGALAAGLLVWNVDPLGRDDPAAPLSAGLAGTAAAPGVSGRMTHLPDQDALVVRLEGLDRLPSGQAYQLWRIEGGVPRSAGVFVADAHGVATVVATDLGSTQAIGLTAQDRHSTAVPQGPLLLTVDLPV